VQATYQVKMSRVGKAYGLVAEDCLKESLVEEDIFHVELLNGSGMGDSSSEHHTNSGRFYNRTEGLIVVNSDALSETPKDPTGLVMIKGPVSTKLVQFGDEPTKFFHATATERYRLNTIKSIKDEEGRELSKHEENVAVLWNTYRSKMGESTNPKVLF
jgi:hypothetical protein